MNEFEDLSSLMKNPNFLKMIQNANISQNLQEKPQENNNNTNIMQMLSNMAPMISNNNVKANNDMNNILNLLPSLIGNNPNNIGTIITLLNMISQMKNNNECQHKKNENKES